MESELAQVKTKKKVKQMRQRSFQYSIDDNGEEEQVATIDIQRLVRRALDHPNARLPLFSVSSTPIHNKSSALE